MRNLLGFLSLGSLSHKPFYLSSSHRQQGTFWDFLLCLSLSHQSSPFLTGEACCFIPEFIHFNKLKAGLSFLELLIYFFNAKSFSNILPYLDLFFFNKALLIYYVLSCKSNVQSTALHIGLFSNVLGYVDHDSFY